jgi:hypothetical protein
MATLAEIGQCVQGAPPRAAVAPAACSGQVIKMLAMPARRAALLSRWPGVGGRRGGRRFHRRGCWRGGRRRHRRRRRRRQSRSRNWGRSRGCGLLFSRCLLFLFRCHGGEGLQIHVDRIWCQLSRIARFRPQRHGLRLIAVERNRHREIGAGLYAQLAGCAAGLAIGHLRLSAWRFGFDPHRLGGRRRFEEVHARQRRRTRGKREATCQKGNDSAHDRTPPIRRRNATSPQARPYADDKNRSTQGPVSRGRMVSLLISTKSVAAVG